MGERALRHQPAFRIAEVAQLEAAQHTQRVTLWPVKRHCADFQAVELPVTHWLVALKLDAVELGNSPQHALKSAYVNEITTA